MEQRLSRREAQPLATSLWAATYILLGLRYSGEFAKQLLRGVVSMKESVTYQAILEEGRTEGRTEGRIEEARNFLLLQGSEKFGSPDPQFMSVLAAFNDVRKLEGLGVRLFTADSW